jgi:hypothetical protein
MALSGKFLPKNTNKYLGDPTNIFYRSSWERRVMVHLDENPSVIGWSNEEIVIPYLSPVDGNWHRYFPDFFAKVKNKQGIIESMIIEVKPASQSAPPQVRSKVTKSYIREVVTWGVNEAKWNAAVEYCKDRKWTFKVITENEIFKKR